ncbi:hypothetical protein [Amycolatopsis vastitatis]|uniref:hypothetical protein n=1 Tax=Amycolatopsis vastitatis TaxID=1905142 RepID=UPI00196B8680|nr:hypothetical protein [Amycolatopsis vastitatis]
MDTIPVAPSRALFSSLDVPRSRARIRWNDLLAPAAAVLIAVLGYLTRWICDDALIFTRIVEQILSGNGPVYSAGERAETSTSALWQWLLALAGFVSGNTDTSAISWMLGLALTAGGFALAVAATRRLHDRPGTWLLPVGVLILLALHPVWQYATSGLETGLNTFWMAACWWLLVRARGNTSGKAITGAALVIGLGPLVRPEQALVAAVFLVALWLLTRPGRRVTLAAAGAAAALPLGYEIFRMGYYGVLVPMPAITKNADASRWARGFTYLTDFADPYLLWIPLVPVTVVLARLLRRTRADRSGLLVTLTPVVAGLLLLGYVLKVGGDYMHARMLLPSLFLVLLPVLVLPRSRTTGVLTLVVVVWAPLCAGLARYREEPAAVRSIDDERAYYQAWTGREYPTDSTDFTPRQRNLQDAVADAVNSGRRVLIYQGPHNEIITAPLRADLPGKAAVLGVYLGTVGMLAPVDVGIVDFWGLSNPIGARFAFPEGKPGHAKPLSNAWLVADYAAPEAPTSPAGNFVFRDEVTPAQVAAARHALNCGDLAEVQRSTREPLTLKRFWANLTGAWHRTQVTIPPDPFEAERKFCGRP